MSDMTNGHTNGFGSDDEVSDLSSDEEEETGETDEGEEPNGALVGTHHGGPHGQYVTFNDDDDSDGDGDTGPGGLTSTSGELDKDPDDGVPDEDSDSDSAPEDLSFKTGRDNFQQKSLIQQKQIEKSLTAAKEKRRRRDDLLKEQKAAKLAKLKEARLSADFLESLDSTREPSSLPPDPSVSSTPSSLKSSSITNVSISKRRKVFSLPEVEGTEFEVVVEKSEADREIMEKTNRFIKRYSNPKSIPRLTAKKKQSLASKKKLLKRSR